MFDPAADNQATGSLYRVQPDGTTSVMRTGIGVPNGLAFSPDGRTMYWADTHRDTVWAYDYDAATGEATNERVFLDFATLPGRPDGACVDAEGGYWIACVYGSAVLRVTPDGVVGPADRRAHPEADDARVRGPDVVDPLRDEHRWGRLTCPDADDPEAGGLFAIDLDVRGLADPVFAGGPG
jgi:sugar lactone lactonase YvrE